ncbi:hypothetical protein SO802_032335 [Lithocarpus litseifolius]|uniref:Disease resistance protein RPS4B/Roq1-like leucine-rich repeats domain-containing protein n=1 Tax=Lithocarpus litseifolius TaxID=425828 RepID=A0AAW2BN01_9ROSI
MLKFICLKKSLQLIETLNFNKIPNLEKLVLKGCINLLHLHPSIGVHKKLILLNLKGCKNLRSPPRKFEMESLEILILSDCLKVKRILEFGENMECVSKLYLDATTITKLPTSIGNLTGLALLDVRDCKNLMSLPSTFFNMKSLTNLNFSGCSKLLESLWRINEEPGARGILTRFMASSNALIKTLKNVAFSGFKLRIPGSMCQLSNSLMGLGSLTNLDLSRCNLNAIPNDIGCLSSLEILNLSDNKFECLPKSISQLSALQLSNVADCMKLISLPELPLSIRSIKAFHYPSLKEVTNLLKPNSLYEPTLLLSDCGSLANNQDIINTFFAVIRKHLQCTNNSITPFQGLDVLHHDFDNSVIVEEGNKVKRSRDDYDGAGPRGEGSSNDVPHPKRIERVPEFSAHGLLDLFWFIRRNFHMPKKQEDKSNPLLLQFFRMQPIKAIKVKQLDAWLFKKHYKAMQLGSAWFLKTCLMYP